ncbi:ComEC/Rec2 family competence protein [Arthrobacter sp. B6]|uniref:ComEC/Rec2 family competence protein n=1 Tax=Arthrobacter sp. B6 TaxID=1570137 RepID=UPI000ADC6E67|nr:ComEC/Rec2 family competence protein [Arthrobacter sp. B6]
MESAVQGPDAVESPGDPVQTREASARAGAEVPGLRETVRHVVTEKVRGRPKASGSGDRPRRRMDVRLAPAALLVWCAAIAGVWLTPAALLGVCCGLLILATALLGMAVRSAVPRSVLTTAAVAVLLAVSTAAHSAVSSSQRNDGPLADAVRDGRSVVAIMEITGAPRAVAPAGQAGTGRWAVPATALEITAGGEVLRSRADIVVMGGGDWGALASGQRIRSTGKLKPADPGQTEAGILAASSAPVLQSAGSPGLQEAAGQLRGRYVSAAAFLAHDSAGLLPGMVTGDTSALDEGLNAAMRAVGMTHLTAVSGANCSLVLGALLLLARSLRLPRVPAAALALAGLALFVLLVGPDASVLRAALMGSIALASLAGGRTGRGLSFLCLAVIGLLLFEPGLGTSFGFLLSVLATLGIIVLGQRMVDLTPAVVPRWVAAAFAVPLSAQLLCGPVIVLLQPQFSTYSLMANVVAAPLVAPVTLLGTAAVPLTVLAPWAATVLIAVAGTFCGGVAGTARFMAGLPGASLPWPEGAFGLVTMLALSVLTLAIVLLALRPRAAADLLLGLHRRIERLLEHVESLPWPPWRRRRHTVPWHGLEPPSRRGRLRHCTNTSGRNPEWPLRRMHETGRRRPARPPGRT